MNRMTKKRLGEILIGKGLITEKQLEEPLSEQRLTKEFLGAILVKRKLITEEQLLKTLSEQMGIPFVHLEKEKIDWNVSSQFSNSLLIEHKCFPIRKDDLYLTVASANPMDMWPMSELEKRVMPLKVKLVLATQEEILKLLRRHHDKVLGNIQKMLEEN